MDDLVQSRVLDRDRRLRGEELDDLLVVFRELRTACFLGQVEVAVRDIAKQDRHAQEGPHRRVVRREPDRARIVGEVREAERFRVPDEHPQDAATLGELADRRMSLAIDPGREEPLQPYPL